ncbi:MAG: TrmB family transcriptional regulator, partial [Halanaeroarchaeum sp.]
EGIEFPNVIDSESCTATLRFQDPVQDYEVGDLILVGPTPRTNLVVGGEIVRVDSPTQLHLDVGVLEAPVTRD